MLELIRAMFCLVFILIVGHSTAVHTTVPLLLRSSMSVVENITSNHTMSDSPTVHVLSDSVFRVQKQTYHSKQHNNITYVEFIVIIITITITTVSTCCCCLSYQECNRIRCFGGSTVHITL